jgi:hypothetical protein
MKKSYLAMIIILAGVAVLSLMSAAALGNTNIALGKGVTIEGAGTVLGGTGDLVTDGTFQTKGTAWNVGSVYWNGDVKLVIDLGGSYTISGLIVQADNNDYYWVEYWNGSDWNVAWGVDPVTESGLQTRPNADDNTEQHMLTTAITTDKLRIQHPTGTYGDGGFSVSEVQAFGDPVPAPPSVLLLGSGLLGLGVFRRKFYQG